MPVLSARADVQCDTCQNAYTVLIPLDAGPYGAVVEAALDAAKGWKLIRGILHVGETGFIQCPTCQNRAYKERVKARTLEGQRAQT